MRRRASEFAPKTRRCWPSIADRTPRADTLSGAGLRWEHRAVRRWTQAIAAALVALPLAACSARPAAGDCGASGLAPHPEIGGELVYTCFDPLNKSEMFLFAVT